jgi:hypothetical protein
MILLVLLAQRINRMLFMYFSMVRRRAACASLVRASASLIMTTWRLDPSQRRSKNEHHTPLKRCLAFKSTCCVWAISLRISWITTRSYIPTSLRISSHSRFPFRRSSRRGELDVIVGLHDVHIEFPVRGGHENPLVYSQLGISERPHQRPRQLALARCGTHFLDTWAVEFSKSAHDSSLPVSSQVA